MLSGIATFAMQGRWQAAIVTALLSFAALMLPPLSYLASGILVLTTLRIGPKEGIKVVAAATVIFTLLAGFLLGQFYIAGAFLLSSWLPVLVVSLLLGYTRSLAVSLLAASGLGILVVLGTHIVLSDPTMWWQQILIPFFEVIAQQPGWQFDQQQTQDLIVRLSGMMTGLIAAGLSANVMFGLLIGRAWQAKLFNPGGFASEFYQLKLGKQAAIVTIVLMVISVLPVQGSLSLVVDCLPIALTVFALQGLAVIHAIVKQQQKQKFWLIAVYVLLVMMMPQMVVILATLGVLEQWMNFRKYSAE
ncbi:DUF2232 domain-containing protein [Methylophaga sp. 41_12_T18]|nr:DUF2232 domain-containing protein [Methylophaga sp. 41_12_T18]